MSPRVPTSAPEATGGELANLVDLIAAREGQTFNLQLSQTLAVNSPLRHVAEKRKRSRPLSLFLRTDKTGMLLQLLALQKVSEAKRVIQKITNSRVEHD